MWFDEPRVQLVFEKVMEKLTQVEPQYATGENKFLFIGMIFKTIFIIR
jgi:hypothetical protein